jgi:hypothetical protein
MELKSKFVKEIIQKMDKQHGVKSVGLLLETHSMWCLFNKIQTGERSYASLGLFLK